MAARYATQSFTMRLASGADHFVLIGSLRDSTHGAVTGTPAGFWSASPVTPPDPRLAAYLAVYPDGGVP